MAFLKNLFFNNPVPEEKPNRIICWFEIPAADFKRATVFYSEVFGYAIDELNFNGSMHGIIRSKNKKDQVNGAIVETKNMPSQPMGTIVFFDVNGRMESVVERILQQGGKIIQPKTLIKNKTSADSAEIPKTLIDGNQGYYAYFTDTEGNKIGLFSNS